MPNSWGRAGPQVRVGCSGWEYPGWSGVIYPPDQKRRDWFSTYAQLFDTVEINSSFYRLPSQETVERWAAQAPPEFCYSLKVGNFVTHRKKLREPERWLANHVDRFEHLGPHLGPNLVQLPPHWRRNTERLDEFLAAAPRHFAWAVEFRDPSWIHDDTFAVLARHEVALCIHDLIADHPWVRTAGFTYLRFHGPHAATAPYGNRYTGRRLRRVAARLEKWISDGTQIWVYFNNDIGGHAVTDATWLKNRLLTAGA